MKQKIKLELEEDCIIELLKLHCATLELMLERKETNTKLYKSIHSNCEKFYSQVRDKVKI